MTSKLDNFETVILSEDKREIEIIDQTLLPREIKVITLKTREEVYEAIKKLRVRGAPAIGVCAALGVYISALHSTSEDIFSDVSAAAGYIRSSRPTAVNLMWAVDRMMGVAEKNKNADRDAFIASLLDEAEKIYSEDIDCCRKIGENGLALLKKGDGILTHCNAGRLATVKYGTATAPMYLGHERGYNFKIYCDETRPLLQGARLTATELSVAGLDVTLLCDNMSGALMKTGKVNAVIVGCDRVAANGDTANKIGTSMVATLAARYKIPFYVAAPTSTIDMSTSCGEEINIEQREALEVTDMWYKSSMAPEGIKVFNPAFDVTDSELITAFITEKGVVYPPFRDNFKALFEKE